MILQFLNNSHKLLYIHSLNGKGHVEDHNLQEKEISHDLIGLSSVDPLFGPKCAKREIAHMSLIVLIAILSSICSLVVPLRTCANCCEEDHQEERQVTNSWEVT